MTQLPSCQELEFGGPWRLWRSSAMRPLRWSPWGLWLASPHRRAVDTGGKTKIKKGRKEEKSTECFDQLGFFFRDAISRRRDRSGPWTMERALWSASPVPYITLYLMID